jgi:hypothetical protein
MVINVQNAASAKRENICVNPYYLWEPRTARKLDKRVPSSRQSPMFVYIRGFGGGRCEGKEDQKTARRLHVNAEE